MIFNRKQNYNKRTQKRQSISGEKDKKGSKLKRGGKGKLKIYKFYFGENLLSFLLPFVDVLQESWPNCIQLRMMNWKGWPNHGANKLNTDTKPFNTHMERKAGQPMTMMSKQLLLK